MKRSAGIGIGAVVVVVAGLAYLQWDKRVSEKAYEDRKVLDDEVARYYLASVRAPIAAHDAETKGEPTYVRGKVLPIAVTGDSAMLDGWVYPRLPEALRAKGTADAGTLAIVATNQSFMYSTNNAPAFGIITSVTVTLFDVARAVPTGHKDFRMDPPGDHASSDQLDAYSDAFWKPVAAYLAALPRQ